MSQHVQRSQIIFGFMRLSSNVFDKFLNLAFVVVIEFSVKNIFNKVIDL